MGNVAGSGGYFVAMAADRVIARPGTITGSIGVVAGKVLTTDLWSKIGIRFDDLRTADSATYFSSRHDYTPEQWEHFQAWLDATYDDFLSKVSSSRSLERERVCEVAKGRIWSGSDALDHGLVDALGGLPEAVAAARELAAIPDKRRVRLRVFPEAPSWLGVLLGEDGGDEDEPRGGK